MIKNNSKRNPLTQQKEIKVQKKKVPWEVCVVDIILLLVQETCSEYKNVNLLALFKAIETSTLFFITV